MANKIRCKVCKHYGLRETFYRHSPMESICSEDCFAEFVRSKYKKQSTQRSLKKSALLPQRGSRRQTANPIPTATRKRVNERDGQACRWCGTTTWVELHHINYRSEGVDHSDHNLITLCKTHHDLAHSDKRRWKPMLLGVMWVQYVEGRKVTVPSFVLTIEGGRRTVGS